MFPPPIRIQCVRIGPSVGKRNSTGQDLAKARAKGDLPDRDIIVIGASAGGRDALTELFRDLSAQLPAAFFIVWHMSPYGKGMLPYALARVTALPVADAQDGEPIVRGRIYVAPVDHHLLVERDRIRVTKGPRENRFRPAIDPLFRSAAYAYGPRVIGVVLSGALNDGTSGLWAIKDRGGIAIVQDPDDAQVPSMPQSAIENVEINYRVPVAEMPALLQRLVSEQLVIEDFSLENAKMETEVNFAKAEDIAENQIAGLGQVSELTCPECHGALWRLMEGKLMRFRCRTGHAYTAEALLQDLTESIEVMEWTIMRGIEERAALLRHMAQHLREGGDLQAGERVQRQAEHAWEHAQRLRRVLVQSYSAQPQETRGNAPNP